MMFLQIAENVQGVVSHLMKTCMTGQQIVTNVRYAVKHVKIITPGKKIARNVQNAEKSVIICIVKKMGFAIYADKEVL